MKIAFRKNNGGTVSLLSQTLLPKVSVYTTQKSIGRQTSRQIPTRPSQAKMQSGYSRCDLGLRIFQAANQIQHGFNKLLILYNFWS